MSMTLPSPPGMFRSERFDLRKLHYFAQIVELGSISRASSVLRTAQPALSKSIRLLEFDLRTPLLERSARGVRPTRAGERLYEHCKTIFRQLEQARADLQGDGEEPRGCVTIGLPYSVSVILAAPLLRATLSRHPGIDLRIVEAPSATIARHLASSHVDVGIMVAHGDPPPAIEADALIEEDLFLIRTAHDGAPLDAPVRLEDLAGRPLILPRGQLRAMVEERFAHRAIRMGPVRELETFSMIPQCVEAGIGDAILPGGWISAAGTGRISRAGFACGTMRRYLSVGHTVARPQGVAARCVTLLLRQTAAQLVRDGHWQGTRLSGTAAAG